MGLKVGGSRWGNAATIEGLLEEQEKIELEEAEAQAADEAARAAAAADGGLAPLDTPMSWGFNPSQEQRDMVKNMSRCNMPHDQMTLMVRWPNGRPISVNTLRRHFADELQSGFIEVGMQLFGALYKKALAGDSFAASWLLARGYGFRETVSQELSGPNGKDLNGAVAGVIIVPGMASSEEWEASVKTSQQQLAERAAHFAAGTGEFAPPDPTLQ